LEGEEESLARRRLIARNKGEESDVRADIHLPSFFKRRGGGRKKGRETQIFGDDARGGNNDGDGNAGYSTGV